MPQLDRRALFSLEQYSEKRDSFRAEVLAAKKSRAVQLGDHVVLLFENRLTIQYQVQEMLRIEKIFEAAGIEEELEAYNPLIPDGDNWKATMMIQYDDVEERRRRLVDLVDIENQLWVQVGGGSKVVAIADEDLDRADEHKTSAVHFLRFQLDDDSVARVKAGEPIVFGTSHPEYPVGEFQVSADTRKSLATDLD
ncbi:MAG: DUF3501 family protein [Gammaproteobacteria bacterium]